MENKKRLSFGGALLVLGGAAANETLKWIWAGFLNLLAAGAQNVTWQSFPWLNAIGTVAMLFGAAMLVWPLVSHFYRRSLNVASSPIASEAYDDTALRKELAEVKAAYVAVINDYQRLSALEPKLESLARDFEGVPEKAENTRARAEHAHALIEQLTAQIEKERSQRHSSFYGLGRMKDLGELEQQLTSDGAQLYERLSRGESYNADEWQKWESLFDKWHHALKN